MRSQAMFSTAIKAFTKRHGHAPQLVVRAPGRINLLGAHVDYNEGWVLPAAIDRAIWIAAGDLTEREVFVDAIDFGETGQFHLDELRRLPEDPPWLTFPKGVAWSLEQQGYRLSGMAATVASDLPMEAGVSSSAALEMGFVIAWEALSGFRLDNLARARTGRQVENDYLGVGSGIMDQFACLQGAANQMVLLDCRTMEHELLPVPDSAAVIVADSGVRRRLADIAYNARPEECRQALGILRSVLPKAKALRDVRRSDLERYSDLLPTNLRRRVRHVVDECGRVKEGAAALAQGDLDSFGRLVRRSQQSSRTLYENSIPELDLLAEAADIAPGSYGSRFAGGGFGGVMQTLVNKSDAEDVKQRMRKAFRVEFGRSPRMFTCTISDGAELSWL